MSGQGADRSVRVSVPETLGEQAGAVLMDILGPFEEAKPASTETSPGAEPEREERVMLVFYPSTDGPSTREELLPLLPAAFAEPGALLVETGSVPRDWVEGWRDHFRPIVIGAVRIRPPWEPPLAGAGTEGSPPSDLIDVVINPGLGFGTGLHPTTRGTLLLLQEGLHGVQTGHGRADAHDGSRGDRAANRAGSPASGRSGLGRLVDVGTGSGILAIAAAKLGWSPVVALDNDPVALVSTRENVAENDVQDEVGIFEADTDRADEGWFADATVLANMTLEPVSLLLRRLGTMTARPRRLVVSGILAGSQEEQIVLAGHDAGFGPGRRLYEEEWVSLELLSNRPET